MSTDVTKEQLQAEIERTREHLGETVEQLAAKADVKARVQERVEERKAEIRSNPQIPAAVAIGVVAVVALVVWRRSRD